MQMSSLNNLKKGGRGMLDWVWVGPGGGGGVYKKTPKFKRYWAPKFLNKTK
jgi:hypothetical protein